MHIADGAVDPYLHKSMASNFSDESSDDESQDDERLLNTD